MKEIEFHQKRIELTPGIIAGYKNDRELAILDSKREEKRPNSYFEDLLEFKIAIDKRLQMCAEDFRESEYFLTSHGIDPYLLSMEEQIKLENELMQEIPSLKRTIRARIYVWFWNLFHWGEKIKATQQRP